MKLNTYLMSICILLFIYFIQSAAWAELIERRYSSYFTLTMDCEERAAMKFDYLLWQDRYNYPRPSSYYQDQELPWNCRQLRTRSYYSYDSRFVRGHLVTSNHMDFSDRAIKMANYMSNILPQHQTFNNGAWARTEDLAECYRDLTNIRVLGGPLYEQGSGSQFINSHGVKTPSHFWKVLIQQDYYGRVADTIAWIIPNTASAKTDALDNFLVSVYEVEQRSGFNLPVPGSLRYFQHEESWSLPSGCDRS